ncbi:hypothetical protein MKX03_029789 [Papaver bracteatum]|nr:hypothetical protein MKX03_029789 [Papaver bracteatum]
MSNLITPVSAFQVQRVASMLNFFLLQLAFPQRKSLTLKDPEKYEFRPKILLKRIVEIYVNLAKGDRENIFASAISKDDRSYNEALEASENKKWDKNFDFVSMMLLTQS